MRPVLVTGANGFLGGHLVRALRAKGYGVHALDLGFDPAARGGLPAEVARMEGTVTDRALMTRLAGEAGAIIHAAAIAHLWAARPGAHDAVNHEGTAIVAEAARGAGIRLVHVSSYTTLVAESTVPGATLTEAEAHAPEALLGPYPASKRKAELAVEEAARDGLDAVTVLPSAPVGPGDRGLTPPARMILDLARGATPAIVETEIDIVEVRALADGIVAAMERGERGERYLLSGEGITLAALAEMVSTRMGRRAPTARVPFAIALAAAHVEEQIGSLVGRAPTAPLAGVRLARKRVRLDAGHARATLGFHSPPAEEAVMAAIDWFIAEGVVAERTGTTSSARS
ncbi:MAG: NAD-dependent epimerase/dehydratase family protein [Pseudomonadota bacterium]